MADCEDLIAQARQAYKSGNPARSQELLEEASHISPDNREVHSMLGLVYEALSESDLSIAEFRRALKIDPDHLTTLRNFARVLEKRGRRDEALQLIERALAIDPADPTTQRIHRRLASVNAQASPAAVSDTQGRTLCPCPICDTPVPADTDRRTCDLCGVNLVPLLTGRVRVDDLGEWGQKLLCSECGTEVTNYKAMHCLKCGHDFLTGKLPGATQPPTTPSVGATAVPTAPDGKSSDDQSGSASSCWACLVVTIVLVLLGYAILTHIERSVLGDLSRQEDGAQESQGMPAAVEPAPEPPSEGLLTGWLEVAVKWDPILGKCGRYSVRSITPTSSGGYDYVGIVDHHEAQQATTWGHRAGVYGSQGWEYTGTTSYWE